MAYYIFLKSLRSLEEFRKNPHVKIPHKSPFTNFQSLGKFKNPILIRKFFSLFSAWPTLRPARPLAQPAHPPSPQAKTVLAGPSSPRVGRVFVGNIFSFLVRALPSRSPLPRLSFKRAPLVSCVFPTTPTDPSRFLPRRPTSDLEMPVEVFTPRLDSPP
jgi:hypothetical protein